MGFGIAWIAVNSASPDGVLAKAGLKRTGEAEEDFEFPISGYRTATGWYVIIYNDIDDAMKADSALAQLSRDHFVLRTVVEEHVMYSSAEAWSGGQRQWQVIHDSEGGVYDLTVAGAPPSDLKSIRAECLAKQNAEGEDGMIDYVFDVPLKLAKAVTGFMHDEVSPDDPSDPYEELTAAE